MRRPPHQKPAALWQLERDWHDLRAKLDELGRTGQPLLAVAQTTPAYQRAGSAGGGASSPSGGGSAPLGVCALSDSDEEDHELVVL
jgi:hypothetical protein